MVLSVLRAVVCVCVCVCFVSGRFCGAQPVSKTSNEEYLLGKKVENWEDVSMANDAAAAMATGATNAVPSANS